MLIAYLWHPGVPSTSGQPRVPIFLKVSYNKSNQICWLVWCWPVKISCLACVRPWFCCQHYTQGKTVLNAEGKEDIFKSTEQAEPSTLDPLVVAAISSLRGLQL